MTEAKVTSLGWLSGSFQFQVQPSDSRFCNACRLYRNGRPELYLDGGSASVPTAVLSGKNGALMCLIRGLRQNIIPSDAPCSPTRSNE